MIQYFVYLSDMQVECRNCLEVEGEVVLVDGQHQQSGG